MCRSHLLILLFSLLVSARGSAQSRFHLQDRHQGDPIGRGALLFDDPTAALTWEQVRERLDQFTPSHVDYPNWKITSSRTWVYFQIENSDAEERDIFLENHYAMTDHVDLYQILGPGQAKRLTLGDHQPFDSRPIAYRNPVFPIAVPPGTSEFLVSVYTQGPNRMPFMIWTQKELQRKMSVDNYLLGIGFGLIVFMIIYNFFICITLQSRTYLYYVLYGLSFLLMHIGMQGVSGYIFDSPTLQEWLSNWGFLAGVQASNIFANLFSMTFLDLKNQMKRIHTYFVGLCSVHTVILSGILLQLPSYRFLAFSSNLITLISTISMMALGIHFVLRRYRPAYFYATAWVFILSGAILFSLSNLDLVPVNLMTIYGPFLGGCCEMALLSFALADRVRLLQMQRETEREHYVHNLEHREKEIEHSYSQLAKVVYPHQVAQMKSGARLEDTMPTGKSQATVIVFDIIGSTRLQIDNKQLFFQKVFSACYQRIMAGYAGSRLDSDAYRVKEMGDGFICSVGFPFSLSGSVSRNQKAVELAFDFVTIFEALRREYAQDTPCFCSIGIAEGEIIGFYPVAGVREYDLYGDALVLAHRYEGIRRVIFHQVQSHLITAQSSVVESLPPSLQSPFTRHEVATYPGMQIRDDPGARTFYTASRAESAAMEKAV